MKTKFKYAVLVAATLLIGFTGCSNDDETGGKTEDATPKNITVRISTPKTYAEEASAVGLKPTLHDATVFFIGGGVIREVGTMSQAEINSSEGKQFENVPGSATKVVIIANVEELNSPDVSLAVKNASEGVLNALKFQQSAQTHAVSAVNAYGSANITGAPGEEAANVTLEPAIARFEIGKVEVNSTANILLTSFKLAGIYINNTYTELGTDYQSIPTDASKILNYGSTSAIWTDGSYPARFKDEWSTLPAAGTEFTPATATNKWSYFVMPVAKDLGTTINTVKQSSVPHIVLKIVDAKGEADKNYGFPETMYITIKDVKVGNDILTHLQRGKVYSISTIKIGGENLAPLPEMPATQNVSVSATVSEWEDQPIEPVLND